MSHREDCCRFKRKAEENLRHQSSRHKKAATVSQPHRDMTVESSQAGTPSSSSSSSATVRFASRIETAQAPIGVRWKSGHHKDVSPSHISKLKPPCLRIIVEFLLSIKNEPCASQEIRGTDMIQSRMFKESSVASTLSIHAKQGLPPIFEKKERRQGNGAGYMWTLNPDAQERLCALYPDLEDSIRKVLCGATVARANTNTIDARGVTRLDVGPMHGSATLRGAPHLGSSSPPLSPCSLRYQTTSPTIRNFSHRSSWALSSEESANRNTSQETDLATSTDEYIHRDHYASDHSTEQIANNRSHSRNRANKDNEAGGHNQLSAGNTTLHLDHAAIDTLFYKTSRVDEDPVVGAIDNEPIPREQARRPSESMVPLISGSALEAYEYVERFACTLHRSRVWRDLPCHTEPDSRLVKHVVVLLKAFDDCCRAGEDQLIEDFSINTDFIDTVEPLDSKTLFGSTIDETILQKTRPSIQDYGGLREAVDQVEELNGMALVGQANMKLLNSVKGLIQGIHGRTGELLQMVQEQCMVSQLDLAAVQREKVTQGKHIQIWVRENIVSPQSDDQ